MDLPALYHRLRGAGAFVAPLEVSATSGYCLPTLRVEKSQRKRKRKIKIATVHNGYIFN
jgi:hypothetical protein